MVITTNELVDENRHCDRDTHRRGGDSDRLQAQHVAAEAVAGVLRGHTRKGLGVARALSEHPHVTG